MLSFLQQLQIARRSPDERQLRYLHKAYNLNVKVLDTKDEKFSNKDIEQQALRYK